MAKEHCQHFCEIPKANYLLVRPGKPNVEVCDACAEELKLKGEDVRKILGELWGFPVIEAKPNEIEGFGPIVGWGPYPRLVEKGAPFNGKEQDIPE